MSFADLKAECSKRNLKHEDIDNKSSLIALLVEDDKEPPDWGLLYSRVLYHTGMGYGEISNLNFPQIYAILSGAEENIPLKAGFAGMLGPSSSPSTPKSDGPPSVSQFAAMASMFDGVK